MTATPALRDVPLDRFFRPEVVAFVGLSATRGHPSRLLYKTIKNRIGSHGGIVHPVNPRFDEIDGARCYHAVADVPGEIDLTVITVSDALTVLDDVLSSTTKFVMIFGAGFSESGADGVERERELAQRFHASSAFLLGPNTTLNSFLPQRADLAGRSIALVSHSGHQGRHIWQAQDLGIPLGFWAPTGNEVDLEFADFARYFADQPEVGAIAAYVEGFRDGTTVRLAADHAVQRGVPIVMCMVGRSEVGRSSAMTHTAHLTGSDVVAAAALEQFAIQRVDTIDELLYTSAMFARAAPPVAPGVCVYSISGGTLAHLSDLLEINGVPVPELAPATQARLRELIPDHLRVSNPVDSGGRPSGDERGRAILDAILDDPGIGVLVIPFVADAHALSERMVADAIDVARTTDKPVCVVWGSPTATETVYARLIGDDRVVTFRTFGQTITALRRYFAYHRARAAYTPLADVAGGAAPWPAVQLPEGVEVLSERASKALLAEYGIRTSNDVLVTDAAAAGVAALDLGGRVVMKISSADIHHKSDLGLVEIGVPAADAPARFAELIARAQVGAPDADVEGVLVCEVVRPGLETIIGIQRDPVFGPVVLLGLGGVLVEVLRDVAVGIPPFSREHAARMVDSLRCRPLFDGVRGMPPADVDAVVDVLMAVQRFVVDHGDRIAEVDINPLVVHDDGAVALDALVRLRAPD